MREFALLIRLATFEFIATVYTVFQMLPDTLLNLLPVLRISNANLLMRTLVRMIYTK